MKMIRTVYLLCGLLFAWINGVKNEAMCYNNYFDEVKYCAFGCCGTDLEVECCLPSRLITFAAAGAAFFVILVAAVVVICYRKQRALERILVTGSRVSIENGRTLNSHHATIVNNNPSQWRPCSLTTDPPPYIGPPPPYTAANSENLGQSFGNSQQLSQPAPPAYTNSCVQHGCISPNPQTSLSYNEPPPQYGVYADLCHGREQRM